MTTTKRAIVNYSTPVYYGIQERLFKSFTGIDKVKIRGKKFEPHEKNPYAFKIRSIETALISGYTQILWLDSSCYAVNDPAPIFDIIEKKGYFMEQAGHMAGNWTNDRTLEYFKISRNKAMKIQMYSAGFTGINFDTKIGWKFFSMWRDAMEAGMFKGAWHNKALTESKDTRCKGHRHDMSCASIIAHKLKMEYEPGGSFFQYGSPESELNHNGIIFKLEGI
jgi:hypothetical protein